jgi:hypothetical protein
VENLKMGTDMILGRGLTVEETAKLKQVEDDLSPHFAALGYVVRVCEGDGHGDKRTIGFRHGFVGPPLVSIPAARFLTASVEELRQLLTIQKGKGR